MNYNNSEFLASYGLSRQLPDSDRPEIVFSGRSNVGKSSLLNKILGEERVIVSNLAGTTRQRHAGQNSHHQLLPRRYGLLR